MARKRRKKTKKITLNKYQIWFSFLGIWATFFFARFMAEWSPLFSIISIPSYFVFWELWSYIFFAVLFILWTYILINEKILKTWIFKKFFFLILATTGIFSFPLIEDSNHSPEDLGWWIWYTTVLWANFLLGWQEEAIKLAFIIAFLWIIIWILYSLNIKFSLWSLKFVVQEQPTSKKSQSQNKNDSKDNKEKTKTLFDYIPWTSWNQSNTNNNQPSTEKPQTDDTVKSLIKEKFNKKIDEKTHEKQEQIKQIKFPQDLPSFDTWILQPPQDSSDYEIDDSYLIEKAEAIKAKLDEFGIPVSIEWYNIWPTVIQIKIKPQAWIKIARIENLKKDLSLALKTKSLRVIAPIPGTEFVWVEIPNPKPQMVSLSEILWSNNFGKNIWKSQTNLTLWKWIDWNKVITPLDKMPHLLVAWATGSGKSVWINDFILSLIYQNTPSDLKFIMVDPKQVELGIYEWIPYLLSPIITEPEKAVKVLKWAVDFMNERYQKLKKQKVRNIDQYNKKVNKEDKMYRLIIIIDELADLMMSWSKKDTENYIARIAQMARAVWIHLILATQRPSVNVITWVIKANIPTRIAFGVVSLVDSRTILDSKWAEDLVGKWDMLYMDPNTKFPVRIQAPFVDTDETEEVVSKIKEKYMTWIEESQIYHPEIINILESKAETVTWWGGWDDDELVEQAIQIISETKKASATMLQRKLWIWFARAAKIMDILEERWVVWPADWAKPREIYV